jgi:hypothetical protein
VLRAEQVRDLFVLRTHLLGARALGRLGGLPQRCGLWLWLIVHRRSLRHAQQRALDAVGWHAMGFDTFQRRWTAASQLPPSSVQSDSFPAVPGADFPVFRAACRRLLDPDSFAQVDRCYRDALRQVLAWLAKHNQLLQALHRLDVATSQLDPAWRGVNDPTARNAHARSRRSLAQAWDGFTDQVARRLLALTATPQSPAETLVRLRAAQAAFLRHGLLLYLDPTQLGMLDATQARTVLDAQVAARLRGCCTPQWTAAAAIALATHAGAPTLTRLRIGHLASDATAVQLDSQLFAIPAHARSLVRALLVERGDQHASADAPLFPARAGRPASDQTIRRALEQAALHAGIAVPGSGSHQRPAAWLTQHGLTLTRLHLPPPDLTLG